MRTITLAAVLAAAALVSAASVERAPDVQTKELTYSVGSTKLTGLLAWDANAAGKRPGVLVVHEWWGHDEHARNQAKRFAEAGYVAFALDMYGDGKHADHPDDAQKFSTEATKDPAVVTARFNAARGVLTADPHVDKEKIAAIGYCFGGGIVLNMARAGQDLDAVVTFHGSLDPALQAKPGTIKPRILVLAGGDDPFVPLATVEKFRAEMNAAGANFRIVTYPGVKHSFTNPKAETHGMPQLGYNKEADTKSWQEMLAFFKQVFG
jgi:dienelactone hydrolase